jgi:catechol 2,3-dioxygenase-like lactoylglutathione lyase family enzyme
MTESIRHVGVLVRDLDEAVERWSRLTGWTFKEISRYEPDSYVCNAAPSPHPHSQRIAMSIDGPPHVELLEVNPDEPTHGETELGLHHIAFLHVDDVDEKMRELGELGIGADGVARDAEGAALLFFADPASDVAFDGVRVEYARKGPHPVYVERDSPAYRAENGLD